MVIKENESARNLIANKVQINFLQAFFINNIYEWRKNLQ